MEVQVVQMYQQLAVVLMGQVMDTQGTDIILMVITISQAIILVFNHKDPKVMDKLVMKDTKDRRHHQLVFHLVIMHRMHKV
jgi:hypothetical protein